MDESVVDNSDNDCDNDSKEKEIHEQDARKVYDVDYPRLLTH